MLIVCIYETGLTYKMLTMKTDMFCLKHLWSWKVSNSIWETDIFQENISEMSAKCESFCSRFQCNHASGDKTRILHENQVNTKATDALAPYVTMTFNSFALTTYDHQICVFHLEKLEPRVSPQCEKKIFSRFFRKKFSCRRVNYLSADPFGALGTDVWIR